jgi:histidinol dehydrogenase
MKKILFPEKSTWSALAQRPMLEIRTLDEIINPILDAVGKEGDKALIRFTEIFDKVTLSSVKVSPEQLTKQALRVESKLKKAIEQAASNIFLFHKSQQELPKEIETSKGINCWRKSVGIEKVGLYIPGGSAPLFSTLLMLAIPAKIAGCKEIVVVSPPLANGEIADSIAYVAILLELPLVFSVGGAQAIAALAYGTESVPKVDKIFGPGNQYVSRAKQILSTNSTVSIDLPAGPTEMLIIADDSANPEFVTADLLSQAEHGADSQVVLVSTSETLIDQVQNEFLLQFVDLDRRKIAEESLSKSLALQMNSLEEAIEFSNLYAPEHLILAVENPRIVADKIENAGSVFLGHYTPESLGDYASGTNHTLPTNGAARSYSGVSLDSFVKKITFQEASPEGLMIISETVETMACAEGLMGHARAVSKRSGAIKS